MYSHRGSTAADDSLHHAGSAIWLTGCTRLGFPVSTTQSIVGGLVGVGIALDIEVRWGWKKGSVSQIAASWGIAPLIAAAFGAIIMMSIKVLVHWRKDPLKAAMQVITFYYALTAGILALFIVISGGHGVPKLNKLGLDAVGIVLGVFFGVWALAVLFFLPYFWRKYVPYVVSQSLQDAHESGTDSSRMTVAYASGICPWALSSGQTGTSSTGRATRAKPSFLITTRRSTKATTPRATQI